MGGIKPKTKNVTELTKEEKQHVLRVSKHWHYNLKLLAVEQKKPISKMIAEIFEEYFKWNHLDQYKYEQKIIKRRAEKSSSRTQQNQTRAGRATGEEAPIARFKSIAGLLN
jgi:hypothetical protein